MNEQDVRWVQRLKHFIKALSQLQEAVTLSQERLLSKLEEQGLIQTFEYTFLLAWNTIKDYFESQGETDLFGSRDAFRLAFKRGVIENGETWMEMLKSRTQTTYTYNEDLAKKIASDIVNLYFPEFEKLCSKMKALEEKTQ